MEYKFSFGVDEAIALRKQVVQFYSNVSGKKLPNTVDDKDPALDVTSDFQMILYVYMAVCANSQMQQVESMTDAKGRPMIRQEARRALNDYKREYGRLKVWMPMNDVTFVSRYSDVDEVMEQTMERIVEQTYYPLLNDMLNKNRSCDSLLAQACARLIVAESLMVLSLQRGMAQTHKVVSRMFETIVDKIGYVTCYMVQTHGEVLEMDEHKLEKQMHDMVTVVENLTAPLLNAVYAYARGLNLYHYVKQADMTKSEHEAMYKQVQAKAKKTICKF